MSRSFCVLITLAMLLVACSQTNPMVIPTASPTLSNPPTLPTQTATPILSPTHNPFPNPVLKVTGEEEIIFDWTIERCDNMNIPDLPVRAFRNADEQVNLILSSNKNYRMIGPDLNNLEVSCNPIMTSGYNEDPSQFNDNEWIASPYTEDGRTVYAIIHNEYHGWEHPGECSKTTYFSPCWYNALTLAVSTDGGMTYAHAFSQPGHLIANLPIQYKADAGPAGPRNPSTIIKGKDGYYYLFTNMIYYADNIQWVCLLRTQNISDPTAWRFWDGKEFNGQFVNPYGIAPANPDSHVCPALDSADIGAQLNDSITYNTYLERYVLTGISADTIEGREIWGIYYSFSDDLIQWTRRKLLVEMVLPWTAKNNTDVMYLYPALIDPTSDSRNFETTGKTAYLYFTRHNFGQGSLDRDLIRVAVEFFPSP